MVVVVMCGCELRKLGSLLLVVVLSMETQSTSHGATQERSETKPDHSHQYSGGLGSRGLSDTP